QQAPLGQVVEDVVGRDERQAGRCAECLEAGKALHIIAAIEVMNGEIGAAPKVRGYPGGKGTGAIETRRIRRLGRQDDDDLPVAVRDQIGIIEMALAFGGTALAEGQYPREPAIAGPIRRDVEETPAVGEIEPAADDKADPDFLRRMMRPRDAG